MNYRIIIFCVILIVVLPLQVQGQMERERANVVEPVETFWTPTMISQATTQQLQGQNLNVTIMHSFGIATTNLVQNFFGLDNIQNVRLGLDYGITDRWSMGVGRSSLFNVVDLRSKYAVMKQKNDGSTPLNLTLKGDIGVVTQENHRPFRDDFSTIVSVIASRKFSDSVSLQLSPMYGYYSSVEAGNQNQLFSLGMASQVNFSERFALMAEYYPILGDKNPGTHNAFSLGLNIQTGGHVFQLFFASTRWHIEQYVIAQNSDKFWAGDFRFGFNVNRIFGL